MKNVLTWFIIAEPDVLMTQELSPRSSSVKNESAVENKFDFHDELYDGLEPGITIEEFRLDEEVGNELCKEYYLVH